MRRNATIVARLVNTCWSIFQWGLLLAVGAAVVLGAYLYLRLDDEIRRHVEARLSEHYRHLNVHVGSARFDQERGITIYDVSIAEPRHDETPRPLLSIDELLLSGNVQVEELLAGEPHVEQIVVQRATLRAMRGGDGRWNVKTLLPLPKFSDQAPTLTFADATLIFEDTSRNGESALTLRGIDATLTPVVEPSSDRVASAPVAPRFRVEGIVDGVPAQSICFGGEIGTSDGSLNLQIEVNGLEVTPELVATFQGESPAELRDVHIHARADASLRLSRSGQSAAIDWMAELALDRGRVEHHLLPHPVTELAAKIEANPRRMFIKELRGKVGMADVLLACERNGWAQNAPLGLAMQVRHFPLDGQLKDRLPDSITPLWDRLHPSGSVDVEARVSFDGHEWSPTVTVVCHDISLTDTHRFPYWIRHANGSVDYRPRASGQLDVLTFTLRGSGGGRPVEIAGEFSGLVGAKMPKTSNPAPDSLERSVAFTFRKPVTSGSAPTRPSARPVGWVQIQGRDIPIHEELLAALPPSTEAFVRSLRPQGAVDIRWRAEWVASQAKAIVSQDIRLKECSIHYERFPYPLHHINGLLTERKRQWKLHGIESRGGNSSTVVVGHGQSTPLQHGRHIDLVFQASDVPLDDTLRDALSPEAQRAWHELQPQGRVDFTAHAVHVTGQEKAAVDVVVRPRARSVSIEPRNFPYRLEEIDGEASFAGGRIELRNVHARHGWINYSVAQGTWLPTAEGGWKLALQGLNGDRLRVHRDLLIALPPRLQKTLERLQLSGTFNLINSSLNLEKHARSNRLAAAWNLWFDCHQVTLHGGTPLENITGAMRLAGSDDGQASSTGGELAIDSLTWKDVQFTNVRGPFWMDRSVCLFGRRASAKLGQPPRPITADAYGGSLAADASLQHDGNTRYQLEAALGGANLNRMMNERVGGPSSLSGTVSGRLSLEGTGTSTHSLNGTGEISVVDANIYELPLLVAMLKVLKNRTPNTTAFNECKAQFTIQGEHVHFQQLNLLGDAVSLYGRGESSFDRKVDLTFYALMGPVDLPIPLWHTLAGGLSEQSMQLKVVGSLDRPDIQRHVLPGVDQVLEQIQNQLDAGASKVVPPAAFRGETGTRIR